MQALLRLAVQPELEALLPLRTYLNGQVVAPAVRVPLHLLGLPVVPAGNDRHRLMLWQLHRLRAGRVRIVVPGLVEPQPVYHVGRAVVPEDQPHLVLGTPGGPVVRVDADGPVLLVAVVVGPTDDGPHAEAAIRLVWVHALRPLPVHQHLEALLLGIAQLYLVVVASAGLVPLHRHRSRLPIIELAYQADFVVPGKLGLCSRLRGCVCGRASCGRLRLRRRISPRPRAGGGSCRGQSRHRSSHRSFIGNLCPIDLLGVPIVQKGEGYPVARTHRCLVARMFANRPVDPMAFVIWAEEVVGRVGICIVLVGVHDALPVLV
mmetsp:Transcript_53688/g.156490  ORF Transcript_53688/g.156490 Transcript_53688/m.156490 type:complete len:319 (-) Transcript_53688:667-1623(-)